MTKLGQLGEFKNGLSISKDAFGSGYPFINLNDIFGRTELTESTIDLVEVDNKTLGQFLVENGDILFVRSSVKREGVGLACLISNPAPNTVYSGFIIRFRPNQNYIYPKYASYYLNSPQIRKQVLRLASSSANTNINQPSLESIKVVFPTITEQIETADRINSIDQKINLLTKKKEALETYKKGLMQKLFSQELRFKREDGTDYPEWRRVKLGTIQEFKNGKPTEPYWCEDGKYEVITLNSVSIKGELKASGRRTNFYDNSLRKGDIVMVLSDIAHANLLGLCDVIPNEGFILNQRMGRLRVAVEIDPYFLRYAINRQQKYFKRRGQGTSQKHIYQRDVDSLTIELPCLDEQIKITETLKSIDFITKRIYDAVSQTSKMKKGLLQQMFA